MSVAPDYVLRCQEICTSMERDTGHLVAGFESGQLRVYDTSIMRPTASWQCHSQQVLSVRCLASGMGGFLTQGREGQLALWDPRGTVVRRGPVSSTGFCRVSLLADHKRCFLALDENSKVSCREVATLQELFFFQPKDFNKKGICWNTAVQGDFVYAGYESGHVVLFDHRYPKQQVCEVKLHDDIISALDVSGDTLLTSSPDSRIIASHVSLPPEKEEETNGPRPSFSVSDQVVGITVKGEITLECRSVGHLRTRPDGRLFVAGCWDGGVRLFSRKSRKLLAMLRAHDPETVTDLVVYDNHIISTGRDKRIAFWTVY